MNKNTIKNTAEETTIPINSLPQPLFFFFDSGALPIKRLARSSKKRNTNERIIEAIKKISKLKYSRSRAIVEQEISQRSFVDVPPAVPPVAPAPPIIPPKK